MNYQKKLDDLLTNVSSSQNSKKPSLLLHACCGPCSSYVLEYLFKFFEITVFYYNPNIYPPEEYMRRFSELRKLYEVFPPALEGKVKVVETEYEPEDFYKAVGTRETPELATEPEKGERCRRCYEFRLRRAYEYAAANQFEYFCTTLRTLKRRVALNAAWKSAKNTECTARIIAAVFIPKTIENRL